MCLEEQRFAKVLPTPCSLTQRRLISLRRKTRRRCRARWESTTSSRCHIRRNLAPRHPLIRLPLIRHPLIKQYLPNSEVEPYLIEPIVIKWFARHAVFIESGFIFFCSKFEWIRRILKEIKWIVAPRLNWNTEDNPFFHFPKRLTLVCVLQFENLPLNRRTLVCVL